MVTKKAVVFISRNSYVGICYAKCSMKRSEEPPSVSKAFYTVSSHRLTFAVKYDFK